MRQQIIGWFICTTFTIIGFSCDSQTEIQEKFLRFQDLYAKSIANSNQKNPTEKQQEQLNTVLAELKNTDQTSFEYHLASFSNSHFNQSKINELKEAIAIKPTDKHVLFQLAAFQFITKDKSSLKVTLKQIQDLECFSKYELNYAKILLQNLKEGEWLITSGFDDTYPILMVQLLENYRPDIIVVPLLFLLSKDFQEELNISQLVTKNKGLINSELLHNWSNNWSKTTSIALTVPPQFYELINTKLYVTGLSLRYSVTSIPNGNLNEIFLNETSMQWFNHVVSNADKKMTANFIPCLLNLHFHYKLNNNRTELVKIKSFINQIGQHISEPNLYQQLNLME